MRYGAVGHEAPVKSLDGPINHVLTRFDDYDFQGSWHDYRPTVCATCNRSTLVPIYAFGSISSIGETSNWLSRNPPSPEKQDSILHSSFFFRAFPTPLCGSPVFLSFHNSSAQKREARCSKSILPSIPTEGAGRNAGSVACNSLGCQPCQPQVIGSHRKTEPRRGDTRRNVFQHDSIPVAPPGLRTGNCKCLESNDICQLNPHYTLHRRKKICVSPRSPMCVPEVSYELNQKTIIEKLKPKQLRDPFVDDVASNAR